MLWNFQIFPDQRRSSHLTTVLEEGTSERGARQEDSGMYVQRQVHSVGQVAPSSYWEPEPVTFIFLTGGVVLSILPTPWRCYYGFTQKEPQVLYLITTLVPTESTSG